MASLGLRSTTGMLHKLVSVLRIALGGALTTSRASHNDKRHPNVCQQRGCTGQVLLVGAGSGDPGMLTLHAWQAMQNADVVLIDYLVSDAIVSLIPKSVEQRYVGKRAGHHSLSQQAICELMIDYAISGKQVVRLKGGDPSMFARASEEAQALQKQGIDYAIVPGVTAASAASAYTGIPLTMRGVAQSVKLVTATLQNPDSEPDWHGLARSLSNTTIVFYMGLGRLETIMQRLLSAGMPDTMPVAVVDNASTAAQQLCIATAKHISEKVAGAAFRGPSLIIVGPVVNQRYAITPSLLAELGVATQHSIAQWTL